MVVQWCWMDAVLFETSCGDEIEFASASRVLLQFFVRCRRTDRCAVVFARWLWLLGISRSSVGDGCQSKQRALS